MCGILFTNNPGIDHKRFSNALNLMSHRGPDCSPRQQTLRNFKLGHTRLKILDLDDRSNQPFWSGDKRYVMIYNGEVYNYKELSVEYALNLQTTSDTEVIIELYSIMGPKMLNLLNGMFSIIILDTKTNEYFAARDRLGIKPLYYTEAGGYLTAASEIASVIELLDGVDLDEVGIRQYRKLRCFFNGHTLYSNINMFPAGCYMKNGKMHKYWSLPEVYQNPPDDEELKDLIKSTVSYRCISDVSVGSYLSGGLDSTIVASLASKPCTWTVGFEKTNEFEWAKMASDKFDSLHTEVRIDEAEFEDISRWMIKKRKEPLSVPNEVLLYKMTKEVKNRNTVILSGEGADELFFGYDRIFRWAAENKWDIEEFDRLYSYGSHDDIEIVEYALSPFLHLGSALEIVASFFQVSHLHGLLRRLDNSTMLCSVEARVPFVDHRLVERMAGVPFEYRIKNGIVKSPLKRIFKDIIPPEIINRTKIGFPVPLDKMKFLNARSNNDNRKAMDSWLEFNLNVLMGGSIYCTQTICFPGK